MRVVRIFLGTLRYLAYLLFVLPSSLRPRIRSNVRPISIPGTKSGILVVAHLYHLHQAEQLLEDIANLVDLSEQEVCVVLTTVNEKADLVNSLIQKLCPQAELMIFENRGRDILPFLKVLEAKRDTQFDIVLKVHTKAERTLVYGANLYEDSVGRFLNVENTQKLYTLAKHTSFVATYRDLVFGPLAIGKNLFKIRFLLKHLAVHHHHIYPKFAAGSMFWMTGDIAQRLGKLHLESIHFEPEPLRDDGSTAHAFERVFGFITADFHADVLAVEDL